MVVQKDADPKGRGWVFGGPAWNWGRPEGLGGEEPDRPAGRSRTHSEKEPSNEAVPGLSVVRHSWNLSIFHSRTRWRERGARSERSPGPEGRLSGGPACS